MYYPHPYQDQRKGSGSAFQRQETNVIKVSGVAEVNAQPDRASVTIGSITEGKELKKIQQENAQNVTAIIQSLLRLDVPQEQIQTTDYRIDTQYDFVEGKQIFRGYKVTHSLDVEINDIRKIGKIVDEAVQSGANYVSNIRFTSSQKERLYLQALNQAVKNASLKAETLAASVNAKINPMPFMMKEDGTDQRPFNEQQIAYVKGFSTTPIEPGQIKIKALVTANFTYS